MNLTRLTTLVTKNLILSFRGLEALIDIFWWPTFDLLLWSFTGYWLFTCDPALGPVWLTGLILWKFCYRANLDLAYNLLSELWSHTLVLLFSTPLHLGEWIIGSMILGVLNGTIAVLFSTLIAYLIAGVTLKALGWFIIPLTLLLLLTGWAIGLCTASFLIYFGQRVNRLVWVIGWVFVPFSGLFAPTSSLPFWAQLIAKAFPLSYIFGSMRTYLTTGTIDWLLLAKGALLAGIYFILALLLFFWMFKKSKQYGLARLETE